MILRNTPSSLVDSSRSDRFSLAKLSRLIISALLGIISGSSGVAAAIGGSIIIQALLGPPATLALDFEVLSLMAAPIGLLVALGLYRAAYQRRRTTLPVGKNDPTLQFIAVCSVLTSLLQILFFTQTL